MVDGRPLRWEEGGKGEKLEIGDQGSEDEGRRAREDGRREKGRETRDEGRKTTDYLEERCEGGRQRPEVRLTEKTRFDIKIKDTYDLINKIKNNELPDKIMINVHPQRWNDDFVPWVYELVWQNVKNVVKRQINKFRNSRI